MKSQTLAQLKSLLTKRLAIIGDHALRDEDSVKHLSQLRGVSEAIEVLHREHRNELPPRLNHFLSQASFQKALDYIDSELPEA